MNAPMAKRPIRIAHSPDSDDAFMFYALATQKLTSDKYDFIVERRDIQELNQAAFDEVYDITAISIHAYAHLADKYALTASGTSMAEKDYGPMLVAKSALPITELKHKRIAVPGAHTTAFLMLKLLEPAIKPVFMHFEKILPAVLANEVDAGLLIHEGQLQYAQLGLTKIIGLNEVWRSISPTLPLPLGGNAVRRSLGMELMTELSQWQKRSIDYATKHFAEARDYAMQFKRDLTTEEADRYLGWYANERTLDMGTEGREAIQLLFATAKQRGVLDWVPNILVV